MINGKVNQGNLLLCAYIFILKVKNSEFIVANGAGLVVMVKMRFLLSRMVTEMISVMVMQDVDRLKNQGKLDHQGKKQYDMTGCFFHE